MWLSLYLIPGLLDSRLPFSSCVCHWWCGEEVWDAAGGPAQAKEGSRAHSGREDAAASSGRYSHQQRGARCPGPEHACPLAASMAPQRKSHFSQIVLRALCTGACVSLVNACVAGESLCVIAPIWWHWGSGLSGSPWRWGVGVGPAYRLLSLHRDPLHAQGC